MEYGIDAAYFSTVFDISENLFCDAKPMRPTKTSGPGHTLAV